MTAAFEPRAWLLLVVLAACRTTTPEEPIVAQTSVRPTGSPLVAAEPAQEGDREFDGIVRERVPAGSYVYLAVEHGARLRWVATMGSTAALGTRVHVQSMGVRHDFHSPRLDRSFDELVFGVVVPASTNERTKT